MKFVSYAQNLEDVMLWRALRNVKNGFYIDVGASDPNVDSVTKVFYLAGWHGINLEPMPSQFSDLARERPRDINLQCAAGAENGTIEIWECDVRGWATASADVVAQHMAGGHSGIVHTVQAYRLADLCSKYVDEQIHFLKIDVEGFEKSVILGMDFSCFRPWIMVIEATRPNSSEEAYMEWEGEVLANGYLLAYNDGLNRFYVAAEHGELIGAFRFPPNVFDDYILSSHVHSDLKAKEAESRAQEAESRAQEAESRAQEAESRAQEAESRAQEAESRAQEAESNAQESWARAERVGSEYEYSLAQLIALSTSTSWRITKPLRCTMDLLRDLRQLRLQQGVKPLMKLGLLSGVRLIGRHPRMKRTAILLATRLGLVRKLHRLYSAQAAPVFTYSSFPGAQGALEDQSTHVRRIFARLKVAIEAHQEAHR
jgi:FkbM family methyltransferase